MIKRSILFFLVFLAPLTFAENIFVVKDIRIEGLQRVSATPVFAVLDVRVGDVVDTQVIKNNIQSIFSTGFFSNIQAANDDGVLIFVVQERAAIKSVNIDGNKALPTDQLTEILGDNGVKEGEILQQNVLDAIARDLERSYISEARYGASVEAKIKKLPNNMVDVEVLIDEGKSAKIRHLNFVGNKVFSDKTLRKLFELRPASLRTIFSSKDQYAREKLTGDIETLESYYLDRGYLDFKVESTQVSISPDRKSVYITLNIHEGDVYTVADVDIGGDPILSEVTMRRVIVLEDGQTYSQASLDSTTNFMTTLLGNIGYTNAEVEGITQKDEENKTVDVTFFIDPGQRVYVRRVEFLGNTQTSDEVLRRELRQLESASASNALIEGSKVRLQRLPYLAEVEVETKNVPGSEDLVDVVYTVEERNSGSLTGSIGFADFSGLNVALNVTQNNWLGTGKSVQVGVNTSRFQTSYNLSFNDPYFTPDGVSRGFGLFFRQIDTSILSTIPFSTDTFGGQVTFGYPISDVSRLGFSLGLENQSVSTGANAAVAQEIRRTPIIGQNFGGDNLTFVRLSDVLDLSSTTEEFQLPTEVITEDLLDFGPPGFIDENGSEFNNARFDFSWRKVTLNRGIFATRGSSQSLQFEATVPGSDLSFYKLRYEAQTFRPITRDLTLRLRTSLGFGDGFGGSPELPFFENFFAGGFGSVRGFDQSTLGPRGSPAQTLLTQSIGFIDINQNGVQDPGESLGSAFVLCDDPTPNGSVALCNQGQLITNQTQILNNNGGAFGGNVLVELGAEIILPIPFAKNSRSMQLVLFVDAGNVFSTKCRDTQLNCSNVDFGELSSAYGVGFTWLSAFGPLTFALSRPINQSEFDQREAFQFTVGTGF